MKISKIIAGICLTGITSSIFLSCSKLTEEPYGIVNSNSFYKTAEDALSGLVYAYAILPEVGYYSRGYYIITELPTENLTAKSDAGQANFELEQLRTTSTNSDLDNLWTYMYRGVARANAVIANVPNVPNMVDAAKNQIIGEAYFLRALHNFNLVRLFGEVPLRLEPLVEAEQIPVAKSSIEAIYDIIIADLKQGEELMPITKNFEGRANRVAAQALLAKVYLQLASSKESGSVGYDFVANSDEMYAQALAYADKVVNQQSVFDFTNVLPDIWNTEIYKNAAISEHIFDAAVDREGEREGNYSKLPNMFLPDPGFAMTIPYNASDPNSELINIGRGWNHFQMEAFHYNSYNGSDKRKLDLIVSEVINPDGNVIQLGINDFSRPFTRKFIDPLRDADKMSTNSPIIRYSDILLIYAEAAGPTTEAYLAVNKIRTRAGLAPLQTGLSTADFRNAVVEERALELAFEGNRLFDLRRTNSMERILVQKYGKSITSGAYFFPIPQREIDSNPLMQP
ncbi:RagB/SusD family nutrient uptake outer membrane protein [Sphingobacterium hungaricum]|uniref:RagB/SusD family nutrient uptake outer membrane protein n=1 Tax=Sphingobacterium hungaricum TaxID=2082723 RepID=A0A928YQ02_9SPHI|nr:RagB/SusD family nutrient uptake outer membrane protein [Sphingobacterium hungaricum]MBE8712455.1 RagB/SusD family nutrient uptake outer membrane protein [Sphingobacterium hungaricum]